MPWVITVVDALTCRMGIIFGREKTDIFSEWWTKLFFSLRDVVVFCDCGGQNFFFP